MPVSTLLGTYPAICYLSSSLPVKALKPALLSIAPSSAKTALLKRCERQVAPGYIGWRPVMRVSDDRFPFSGIPVGGPDRAAGFSEADPKRTITAIIAAKRCWRAPQPRTLNPLTSLCSIGLHRQACALVWPLARQGARTRRRLPKASWISSL